MAGSVVRDVVKVRRVGDTLVVTLTQPILGCVGFAEGDRILLEAIPPRRVAITREIEPMPSTQRVELELQVLERKRHALDQQAAYVIEQHNLSMPTEPGMDDQYIVKLTLAELNRDRANLDVEISQKTLELFDLRGG